MPRPEQIAKSTPFEVTLTLDTAQYASGDVLADTQVLTDIMNFEGGGGIIFSVVLLDKDDQGGALDILFLKTNVSIGTEGDAITVSDGNADEILGAIEIVASDYVDLANSQIATKNGSACGFVVEADASSKDLYIAAISRDTKTYTADGLSLKVGILLD